MVLVLQYHYKQNQNWELSLWEKFHILPKLKVNRAQQHIYYLEEEIIDFSGQLTGIVLAINFQLVQSKLYTPKYNENIEGGLSFKRYNKEARRFHGVFKKETEFY